MPKAPVGRMPERSAGISGDEAKGLTAITAAQPEPVRRAKLAAIAKPKPRAAIRPPAGRGG